MRPALEVRPFRPTTSLRGVLFRKACLLAFAGGLLALVGLAAPEPRPLERTNLMVFRAADGSLTRVKTLADWHSRRAAILTAMQSVTGPLPGREKRCPLDWRIEEEVDCGRFLRRRISYAAEPGARVPAYLMVPKSTLTNPAPTPAILALHQTHPLGPKVVVGLGNSPDDEYGLELARRGYVVLAPPYPLLGDYHPDVKTLGYRSGTMKAIWDNLRGLDLLASLPFVRTNRIGAIGHSLGGHNAVFTAVFDERLHVVVSSCGLDAFVDYKDGDITGWTSLRYMPGLLDYKDRLAALPFDFPELIASLAPRVCFLSAPVGDTNFKWRSVDAVARAAAPVYQLHGVPQNLRVEHPECGHRFPPAMRELACRLFDQHLR